MRAGLVRAAARRCRPWAEGAGKVYLCDVAAELGSTVAALGPELAELNRRGEIELYRADLVAAFDAAKLEASEVQHLGATWHLMESA